MCSVGPGTKVVNEVVDTAQPKNYEKQEWPHDCHFTELKTHSEGSEMRIHEKERSTDREGFHHVTNESATFFPKEIWVHS